MHFTTCHLTHLTLSGHPPFYRQRANVVPAGLERDSPGPGLHALRLSTWSSVGRVQVVFTVKVNTGTINTDFNTSIGYVFHAPRVPTLSKLDTQPGSIICRCCVEVSPRATRLCVLMCLSRSNRGLTTHGKHPTKGNTMVHAFCLKTSSHISSLNVIGHLYRCNPHRYSFLSK